MEKNSGGTAAPATGCYKCGKPGHWSRDCPFSKSDTNPNPTSTTNLNQPFSKSTDFTSKLQPEKTIEKPKKPPRVRPKLTPELFLSDDGLGYVLRNFPKSFKPRGRGHEVSDLGNFIDLYRQWHSRLIPYYSFEQFLQKVEQVGAMKRVRRCINDLKERVARGGDPSKLHEPPTEADFPTVESEEVRNEDSILDDGIPLPESHDADMLEEIMADEIYVDATNEPYQSSEDPTPSGRVLPDSIVNASSDQVSEPGAAVLSKAQITDEQKARMEANRLKALERAAARSQKPTAD